MGWYDLGNLEGIKVKLDKKWEYVIAGVVLGVVAFVLLAYLINNDGGGRNIKNADTSASTFASVGDASKIGPFEFTVTDVSATLNDAGNKEVAVSVSVKNNGKEAETLSSAMFKLHDSASRTYDSDIVASDISSLSLNPGLTQTGAVVFEVPADASGFTAAIRADLVDTGGSDYIFVYLGDI
ncbi:Telomeric repeat-binding factor 2 [compost metagenome]